MGVPLRINFDVCVCGGEGGEGKAVHFESEDLSSGSAPYSYLGK